MKYEISYSAANTHYIDIKVIAQTLNKDKLQFQLPAWRPGRYELGNFSKNIQKWSAFDNEGNILTSKKLTKDLWEVECEGVSEVVVKYNYYAFELNAGSTYLDENQLYVNPVNCFLYLPERQSEECQLYLNVPSNYDVATSLDRVEKYRFRASNFDEMADSPFIASGSLQHFSFELGGVQFYLWFQGIFKLEEERLLKIFKPFIQEQLALFGDFPTNEYHFLYQISTQNAYHGVEHAASTVILLGPSYAIMQEQSKYEGFLGVSSHELFHAWNIKSIRPVEMWPYDFSKENYSRLGYLAEGATTLYGDLMLYRSKVFDAAPFFRTFNQLLDRHFNNPGVKNLSVSDSSFDTWLDGYSAGVPNRKSSIYTEGALLTFLLDVEIRRNSNNNKSFDDVLRSFYYDYYKKGNGVSEADYKTEVEAVAGKNLDGFFKDYVNGTADISQLLKESMQYLGLDYRKLASEDFSEAHLGLKLIGDTVISVFPSSVAEKAGVSVKDKITSVNGIQLNDDFAAWCQFFKEEVIELGLSDGNGIMKRLKLRSSSEIYYGKYEVYKIEKITQNQQAAQDKWGRSLV